MPDFTITTDDGNILAHVQCTHLHENVAQDLLQDLSAAADQTPAVPVLLDLTQVAYMPSMAIGALVTLWKKLQDGRRRFILVGMHPRARSTLAVCRLDKLFEFSDTVDAAKKRLLPG